MAKLKENSAITEVRAFPVAVFILSFCHWAGSSVQEFITKCQFYNNVFGFPLTYYFVLRKTYINLQIIQTVIADFQRVLTVVQAGFLSLNYSCVNTSLCRLVVQSFETELQLQPSFLFALEGLHKSSRQDFLCRMRGKHQHALFYSGGRLQRRIKRRGRERKYRARISDRERVRQWNEGDEAILWRLGFVVCVVVISAAALLCNCPSWLKLERDGDWFSLFDRLRVSRVKSPTLLTAEMILLDRMCLTVAFSRF